jgi:serine protease AprX
LLPLFSSEFAAAEPTLKVLLQGQSSQAMAELVEQQGGQVTHDLRIINAVGALITRAQLDDILESPLVSRYIDDLSISEEPEHPVEGDKACNAHGALDLDRTADGVNWRLYARDPAGVNLKQLELGWPTELGELRKAAIDGKPVDKQLITTKDSGARIDFPTGKQPHILQGNSLQLTFTNGSSVNTSQLPQRQFSFTAAFSQDCKTSLIPGYDDNDHDTYYPGAVGASELHQHGVTGAGITVAVLDSGLWEHPELANDTHGKPRIRARYNAINNTNPTAAFDESGHGTHLTSALANSAAVLRQGQNTGSFKGVAPDVGLIPVKAFNEQGQGDFLDIVRGVQWVVDNREKYNIRVLNLSFAAPPRWPYWQDPVNQSLMRAWQAGITVIAAAGNEGPEPMSVGSPGNLPYIITVGAITDSWTPNQPEDDYIPDFSSRGPTPSAHIKPDIVAPGGHIIGITRPGSTLTQQHPEYMLNNGLLVMTGTSQASAIVSGIAALLLQLEPQLTPNDIKCKLVSSADPAINRDGLLAYSPFLQGSGSASAARAVTLGQLGCSNTDLDLEADISGRQHYQGPAIVEADGSVGLPGLNIMLSPSSPEQGWSDNRKWGVKAHIERDTPDANQSQPESSPFNWKQRYFEEKQFFQDMASQPPL